jgi:hypothetical protein
MHGYEAQLGAPGRLSGPLMGLVGAILRAPRMAGYLSAYRGTSATETLGNVYPCRVLDQSHLTTVLPSSDSTYRPVGPKIASIVSRVS